MGINSVHGGLSSAPAVWSVSALNRAVKLMLETELPVLWVAGEISNLTIAASGHLYFSLKDAGAQVRSVMFRNRAVLLPFKPVEGLRVEARVVATLYEARGEFQLSVEAMRPAGLGALFEAFERLKARLAAEGLFDSSLKRALPAMPRAIGIVTSPQAAALRDVLATLRRRAPHIPVILYPSPVQGEGSAQKLADAIALASRRAEVEVLIVCRGGGSIEDLWSFNEEVVARAIAACSMPVVSGVGHETDITIADFVADQRAPTPTAAAELVAPERALLLSVLQATQLRLYRSALRMLQGKAQKLDYLGLRLKHPGERLKRQAERLQGVAARLRRAMQSMQQPRHWRVAQLAARQQRCLPDLRARRSIQALLQRRLQAGLRRQQEIRQARLAALASRLEALSPHAVLARGYSIVSTRQGQVVTSNTQLHTGDALHLRFAVGEADARVVSLPMQQADLFGVDE